MSMSDDQMPCEAEMRRQMYRTMQALERAFGENVDLVNTVERLQRQVESLEGRVQLLTRQVHDADQRGFVMPLKWGGAEPMAPDTLALTKALALLTLRIKSESAIDSFDHPFSEVKRRVFRFLGIKPCDACVGTGWLARDEVCQAKDCTKGWIIL